MTGSWTGDVEAGPAVAYVQGSNGAGPGGAGGYLPTPGLYRSIDSGRTWVSVGGPSNGADTRFCVTGCDGGTVIAFDDSGGVWETTDGGDGLLGHSVPILSSDSVHIFAARCSQNSKIVTLRGFGCNPFELDSISFLDSTLLRAGALTMDSAPKLPELFDSGFVDLVKFRWNPSNHFTTDTTVTDSVRLAYLDASTGMQKDTILVLTLTAQTPPLANSAPSNLDFALVSTCSYEDSTIAIVNTGCDTIHVDSTILASNAFSILSSDSLLPPGDTAFIVVHYKPLGGGSDQANLSVYVHANGSHAFDPISLTGRGVQGMGVLDVRSTSLQAGSLSFCGGDTVLTDTLRNTGCDTLVITGIKLTGDSAFSLVSVPQDSLLLPGASEIVTIGFAPRVKGQQSATISFHERNIVNDPGRDTSITLAGMGLGGITTLAADTALRDFGAIYACESRDTTIRLANPGCDTLMVTGATFSNPAYSTDTTFPLIVLPDSSIPVRIHLAASTSGMAGTVTFTSNANTGPNTISVPLTATLLQPATLRLVLSQPDGATAGQTVKCYILLEGHIPAGLISALNFNITHNDDLLSFLNLAGTGLSISKTITNGATQTQSFTLSPVPNSDTIGTLTFEVYLSDSSSTPISLSNVSLATSLNLPEDCIASVGDTGTQFAYLYRCGNHLVQDFLQTGTIPFAIRSIVPNPAGASLRVQGIGYRVQGLEVQMFDALGNCVLDQRPRAAQDPSTSSGQAPRSTSLRSDYTLHPIPYTLTLDVSSLPSGIYFLRLSDGSYVVSRSVAIER